MLRVSVFSSAQHFFEPGTNSKFSYAVVDKKTLQYKIVYVIIINIGPNLSRHDGGNPICE